MTTAKPLRKKQARDIIQTIKDQFNITFPIDDYNFYLNTKEKIFLLKNSEHLEHLSFEFIRTDRLGLYFGEYKNGFFRPSMQGVQFLMRQAKEQNIIPTNTLELTKEQATEFFKGTDLPLIDQADQNAIILTFKGNALGFAQIRDQKLFNYVPKTFRGTTII